jgi:pimeloyl-ACP methyl ester carboxylesterase
MGDIFKKIWQISRLPMTCHFGFSQDRYNRIINSMTVNTMGGKWKHKSENSTVVIFIHGLFSSTESCWTHENGTKWPELVANDPRLRGIGVYEFEYKTDFDAGNYSISDIANELHQEILNDKLLNFSRLIFVCHSMGGIVARRAIILLKSKFIILKNILGVFLVASPSLGSRYATFIYAILRYLGHAQVRDLRFRDVNRWLDDLDTDFLNLKEDISIKIKGKELIEDNFVLFPRFFKLKVVNRFEGARYFGYPVIISGSDHFSIAKPINKDAFQHKTLVEFCTQILEFNEADKEYQAGISAETKGENNCKIVYTTPYSIDESNIEDIFNRYEDKWPIPSIIWPKASDSIIEYVNSALRKYDEIDPSFPGAAYFTSNAPRLLRHAVKDRLYIAKKIPKIACRIMGFDIEEKVIAIRNYLLLANLHVHRELYHLSTWVGFKKLNIDIPLSIAPLQSLEYNEAYRRIFNIDSDVNHGRLRGIGDFKFTSRNGYIYIRAPSYVLAQSFKVISDGRTIAKYIIPYIEMELDDDELPSIYGGACDFGVVKDKDGNEL